MTGGSRIIDIRRRAEGDEQAEAPAVAEAQFWESGAVEEDAPALSPWRDRIVAGLLLLVAIAWVASCAWSIAYGAAERNFIVAVISAPLALIGVVYLLLMRNSAREAHRFARTSAAIRTENQFLEAALHTAASQLETNRATLAEQTGAFMQIGEDAAARLKIVTDAMQSEIDTISRQAHALKAAAVTARSDMAVLLADLPKAHEQTQGLAAELKETGLVAHERAGALEVQLASLTTHGREADEIAGGAAQRLAAHLSRMESTSEIAGARLEEAAGQMTEAVDDALNRAAEAVDEARKGMEAQGAAMLAMVEQSRAALDKTGAEAGQALATNVDAINARVESLGAALAAHAESSRAMTDAVQSALAEIETRLAALDDSGNAQTTKLTEAIDTLGDHTDRVTESLRTGGAVADTLIQKSESLLTALDANARELDEALPAAFDRLDTRTNASRAILAHLTPEAEKLEMTAVAAYNRLTEAEIILKRQSEAMTALVADLDARIVASNNSIEELAKAIGLAGNEAKEFAEIAGPQLVESLVQVRETAQIAAERAKDALYTIVPESAQQLARASDKAMAEVMTERVEAQMAEMSAAAERAVETAHKASDRLMRQMLSIADTTAAVEARIEEAKAETERMNEDGFARRVALLIESLNSTAIDVTKILSNEVTDGAWAQYLKGDRGVFTRRAVRLLDSGEVREILTHYDEDAEFRDQINRYVHDFEAMLRNVLGTRDGASLSVTLLSSDMGKLYVALAQAIERLR